MRIGDDEAFFGGAEDIDFDDDDAAWNAAGAFAAGLDDDEPAAAPDGPGSAGPGSAGPSSAGPRRRRAPSAGPAGPQPRRRRIEAGMRGVTDSLQRSAEGRENNGNMVAMLGMMQMMQQQAQQQQAVLLEVLTQRQPDPMSEYFKFMMARDMQYQQYCEYSQQYDEHEWHDGEGEADEGEAGEGQN